MNRIKQFFAIIGMLSLMGLATPANAQYSWNWSFTSSVLNGSGVLTTAGNASSFEAITGITGQFNGNAILSLVDLGTDPGFIYDNLVQNVPGSWLTLGGFLVNVAGGIGNLNIYNIDAQTFGYAYSGNPFGANSGNGIQGEFGMAAPVPEPETYAMMLAGLGLMGFVVRRRRRQKDLPMFGGGMSVSPA